MQLTINSSKLNKSVTFFAAKEGSYIFVDLNNQPGTAGNQICDKGSLSGPAIWLVKEEHFEYTCRKWYKSFIRKADDMSNF